MSLASQLYAVHLFGSGIRNEKTETIRHVTETRWIDHLHNRQVINFEKAHDTWLIETALAVLNNSEPHNQLYASESAGWDTVTEDEEPVNGQLMGSQPGSDEKHECGSR